MTTFRTEGARSIRDKHDEEDERRHGSPAGLETYYDESGSENQIECTDNEREEFEQDTHTEITEDVLGAKTFAAFRQWLKENAELKSDDEVTDEPTEVPYPGWEECHAFEWNEYPDELIVITNATREQFDAAIAERDAKCQRGEMENIETTLNRRGFFAAVGSNQLKK